LRHVVHGEVFDVLIELLVAKQADVDGINLADFEELGVIALFEVLDKAGEVAEDGATNALIELGEPLMTVVGFLNGLVYLGIDIAPIMDKVDEGKVLGELILLGFIDDGRQAAIGFGLKIYAMLGKAEEKCEHFFVGLKDIGAHLAEFGLEVGRFFVRQVEEGAIDGHQVQHFVFAVEGFIGYERIHGRDEAGIAVGLPGDPVKQKIAQGVVVNFEVGYGIGEIGGLIYLVAELSYIAIVAYLALVVATIALQFLAGEVVADALVFNAVDEVGDPDVAAEGKADLDRLADALLDDVEVSGIADGQQYFLEVFLRAHVLAVLIYFAPKHGMAEDFGQEETFEGIVQQDEFDRYELQGVIFGHLLVNFGNTRLLGIFEL